MNEEILRDKLKAQYKQIDKLILQLIAVLSGYKCVQAKIFELPRVLAEETYSPIRQIIPITHEGFVAQTSTNRAYHDYYGDNHTSTKCPLKIAGLVQYQGNVSEVSALVEKINSTKKEFEQTVKSIGNEEEQFAIVHSLFPYLITKQVTRQIHLVADNVRSVGFSFVNKQLSDTIEREAAIARLNNHKFQPLDLMTQKEWESEIGKSISRIDSLPDDYRIIKKRDGKVQTVANISYQEGWKQTSASLPLLYVHQNGEPIKMHDLKPYFAHNKEKNARPSKKTKTITINPWLKLYAKPKQKPRVSNPKK